MKTIKVFLMTLVLAGCSQYSHRMVRVKSNKGVEQNHKSLLKEIDRTDHAFISEEEASFDLEVEQLEDVDTLRIQEDVFESKLNRMVPKVIEKRINSRVQKKKDFRHNYPPSEDEIRRKYENANTMSVISLVMLVLSLLLGFTLIVAVVLSAIALSTYRNYENPGMMDRRPMALGVLISSLII
ncbi:MAG: hypothetical protein ACPGYY_06770, partial [Bacteroidia bacterium]